MRTTELLLKRIALRSTYTIGRLYVVGVYFCDTLEDVVRDHNKDGDLADAGEGKIYGRTAIPYGRYLVKLVKSPRFGRMLPRLIHVTSFEGVLVHAGNSAQDTEGCILVGENRKVGMVVNSRYWEQRLVKLLQDKEKEGKEIHITIE